MECTLGISHVDDVPAKLALVSKNRNPLFLNAVLTIHENESFL
jgi:hypothetical protein